jgi:UDP-GlcNAc3NAcA epimerase
MYDNAMYFADMAEKTSSIIKDNKLGNEEFILCTLHRDNNTDNAGRLNDIMRSLLDLGREYKIKMIMPLHPRTSKMMGLLLSARIREEISSGENLRITGPVGYFDTLVLEKKCRMVITDSGGVQKEAFFFKKPCLVLRPETEWKELPAAGASAVVDADPSRIKEAFAKYYSSPPQHFPPLFGDGKAAEFIIGELVKFLPGGLVV